MALKIVWTAKALEGLDEIIDYLEIPLDSKRNFNPRKEN